MSSKTDMECYNSGWQDGYAEACDNILGMLASIPETPEVYKIKGTLRKTIAEGDEYYG